MTFILTFAAYAIHLCMVTSKNHAKYKVIEEFLPETLGKLI